MVQFRKLFPVALAVLLLGGALQSVGALRNDPAPVEGKLKPTDEQIDAAEEIADKLKYHYRRLDFNDALSNKVLDQYLKDLDPNRLYFVQSDIDEFEKYRGNLDDQLRKGGQTGYTIFNRFQSRLESSRSMLLVDKDLDNLDFEGEDVVR